MLAASFVAAAPLHAQTPITLVGGSPVSAFGYEVGPYTGILGTGSSAQSLFIYCVDFTHTVVPGQQWEVNLTNLGTGAGIGTNTRSGDLQAYRQAAWLTTQYALHPDATADIQATIWNLFGSIAGVVPSSDYWFQQAQANYASLDYGSFLVATDVNMAQENSAQEFIVVTPEPSTVALLATGLLCVVGVATRSRRRQRSL
jgi:PEP-CTERM putative exosortase interaction domain